MGQQDSAYHVTSRAVVAVAAIVRVGWRHAMLRLAAVALGVVVVLAVAVPARAARYDFVVTGDYSADFRIDSSPTVTVLDSGTFSVIDVAGTFASVDGLRNVAFYTPAVSGGMSISQPAPFVSEMSVFGVQVFTGPIDAPTFVPGVYEFTGFVGTVDGKNVRLVISVVPEPQAWLTMLLGMGFVALRVRAVRGRRGITRGERGLSAASSAA